MGEAQSDTGQGMSTQIFTDEVVRVSRHTLAPGETTGEHHHAFPYVVVPIFGGDVRVDSSSGKDFVTLVDQVPYGRQSGAVHSLTNISLKPIDFVEIEFLPSTD